jgi:hypothetical protein
MCCEAGFFATTGCHPTRSAEFDKHPGGPKAYLKALDQVISSHLRGPGRVVAVGECGLGQHSPPVHTPSATHSQADYDRLHFATEETQRTHFRTPRPSPHVSLVLRARQARSCASRRHTTSRSSCTRARHTQISCAFFATKALAKTVGAPSARAAASCTRSPGRSQRQKSW